MAIERRNPDTVYTPPNETYSQVVIAGDHVHVSGMVGLTPEGDLAGPDMRSQAEQAIAMLDAALADAGADVSDLVRLRILTTDAAECLETCHEPIVSWYGEHKPASTLEEVAGLAMDPLQIEIEATAYVGG